MKLLEFLLANAERLWRRRGSLRTLLVVAFLLNCIVLPAVGPIVSLLLGRAGVTQTPQSFREFLVYAGLAVAVLNLCLVLVWLLLRQLPVVPSGTTAVLFAPSSEKDCDDLVVSLYEEFRRDLQSHGLPAVVIDLLPRNCEVNGPKDAHDLLVKTAARLVIFGMIRRGKRQTRATEGFATISFTVRHRPLEQDEFLPLSQSLVAAIAPRTYAFEDDNSFVERNVVIENMSQVSRMFIGLALTLDGQGEAAIPLLEELLGDVAPKGGRPEYRAFRDLVTRCLVQSLAQRFNSIYDSRVVDHITNPAADRDVEECSRLVERIAGLSGDDRQLDLPRAIFAFHAGDLHRARRLVARAGRAAQSVAEPYVSAAFLALWRGDFREALRHYTRAASCERFSTLSMIRVVRFLAGVKDAHPERRQLGFGLAFVNDAFVDPATAKDEYEEFLRNTVDEQEEGWALLRDYATRRVTGEQIESGEPWRSSDESGPPVR